MMRAIIGTVAVLAGFGVVEQSVDASTGLAGSCKATQAYALLDRRPLYQWILNPLYEIGRAAHGL